MKDFPTQRQYIKLNTEGDKTIQELKAEYKRLYFKEYNRQRRAVKKMSIRLSKKEFELIENARKKHVKKSFNRFVIDTVITYLNKGYLQHDPEVIRKLILSINAIGVNVNQIVHKLHLILIKSEEQTYSADFSTESLYRILEGYQELKQCIDRLKTKVNLYTSVPPAKILEFSWDEVKMDENKLKSLIIYLDEHLSTIS